MNGIECLHCADEHNYVKIPLPWARCACTALYKTFLTWIYKHQNTGCQIRVEIPPVLLYDSHKKSDDDSYRKWSKCQRGSKPLHPINSLPTLMSKVYIEH